MPNHIYKRTMQMARRAKREGLDINRCAPPSGSLRDAFMREYNRTEAGPSLVAQLKANAHEVPVQACRFNCNATVINDGVGVCPHREHWG